MKHFTTVLGAIFFTAVMTLVSSMAPAATPFDGVTKILPGSSHAPGCSTYDPKSAGFQQRFEEFKQDCTKGMSKAGSALDTWTQDLKRLAAELKGKISSAGKTSTEAQAPKATTKSTSILDDIKGIFAPKPKTVGDAFGSFIKSIGGAFTGFIDWLKAWWKEATGPEFKDAPIQSTVNKANKAIKKVTMDYKLKKLGNATKDLGSSISTFVKNIFK